MTEELREVEPRERVEEVTPAEKVVRERRKRAFEFEVPEGMRIVRVDPMNAIGLACLEEDRFEAGIGKCVKETGEAYLPFKLAGERKVVEKALLRR